jgi:exopolysaccharide biosynthesis operon protein EpsL
MRKTRLALALMAALASTHAFALFNDRVEIWAAENITHDSNIFRISDDVSPSSIGAPKRGDTIYTTHLGVNLNIPVSLQKFEATYDWYRTRYDTLGALDYDGHRARAAWIYEIERKVSGVVSANETKGLSSFSNIQSNIRDVVRARQIDGTAAWMLTPRWRLDGRAAVFDTSHSHPTRQFDDIEAVDLDLGASYLTPNDNAIGASARFERGRNPHGNTLPTNPFFGRPFENKYRQWALGMTATWNVSAHSRFDGRVEYLDRRYEEFADRNYQGPAFRGIYTWAPTAKLAIAFGALRDMGPPEDVQSGRVLITGAYIRPKWTATEKITVLANAEYNVWEFKGDPIRGGDFEHRVRLVGASLMWKPFQRIWVNVGVNHERRTSSLRFGDYGVNVAFVEGRVGF